MKKKSLLISSLLTTLMCGSLIAGATYSLFTSTKTHDITVKAGTVDVRSSVDENSFALSSMGINMPKGSKNFENGGTVKLDEKGNLILDRLTPGDKITFKIKISNYSTVNVKYRTSLVANSGQTLYRALVTTCENPYWFGLNGGDGINPFELEKEFTIELPKETNNDYQGLSTSLSVIVEAVQANGELPNYAFPKVKSTQFSQTVTPTESTYYTLKPNNDSPVKSIKLNSRSFDSSKETTFNFKMEESTSGNEVFDSYIPSTCTASYYDISLDNIYENNPKSIEVEFFAGKNLPVTYISNNAFSVFHHNKKTGEIEDLSCKYDKDTGYISFSTYSFSKFAFCFEKVEQFSNKSSTALNTSSLQRAFDNNNFIFFTDDVKLKYNGISEGFNYMIDLKHDTYLYLNGHTLSIEEDRGTILGIPVIFNLNGYNLYFGEQATRGTRLPGTIDASFGNNMAYIARVKHENESVNICDDSVMIGSPYCFDIEIGSLNIPSTGTPTFKVSSTYKGKMNENSLFTFNKANYNANTACISINSGAYIFNPDNFHEDNIAYSVLGQNECVLNREVEGQNLYKIYSASDIKFAMTDEAKSNNGVCTLKDDLLFTPSDKGYSLALNSDIILDLNGHTIGFTGSQKNDRANPVLIKISRASNVTIRGNGKIDSSLPFEASTGSYCVVVDDVNSTFTVLGGTYISNSTAIQVTKGTANIKGGKFDLSETLRKDPITNTPDGSKMNAWDFLINCIDANYTNKTAKVNIYGGEFVNYNPGSINCESTPTSFLAEGFESVERIDGEDKVYTVKPIEQPQPTL